MLGVRAALDGLIIDPCVPKAWPGFKVTRKFRGATYEIDVKNPNGVCKGVKKMTVDGVEIAGNVIPVVDGKKNVKVEIVLEG